MKNIPINGFSVSFLKNTFATGSDEKKKNILGAATVSDKSKGDKRLDTWKRRYPKMNTLTRVDRSG